jgi:ribA/ribD-fused uncharacterized protein
MEFDDFEREYPECPSWGLAVYRLVESISDKIDRIEAKADMAYKTSQDCKRLIREYETRIELLEKNCTILMKNATRQEDYSRRCNLKISGIHEQKDENTLQLIKSFFKTELGINSSIAVDKVHRIGKFSPIHLKEPRKIIVRFSNMCDRDLVWNNKKALKGKLYIIHEDFSNETENARRQLYPYAKAARQAGAYTSLKGDTLFINRKPYTAHTISAIPADFHPRKASTLSTDSKTLFYGKYSEFSNFFSSEFMIDGIKYQTNEQYYQSKKAEHFNADEIASTIRNTPDPYQCYKLGSQIPNFNKEQWDKVQVQIMTQGVNAKFAQNPNLKSILLNTGEKVIAECSKNKTWGTGLPITHPSIGDPNLWSGKNMLGQCLMNVRAILKDS